MKKNKNKIKEGIKILSKLFDYPIDPFSQDWTYEVAEPEKISDYINVYKNISLTDEAKILLMEMIFQALDEQDTSSKSRKWWNEIKYLLEENFKLHEQTIHYWCCLDSKLEDSFSISDDLRKLLGELKKIN